MNPIVEELPMDEESDKRIFDEPSKKPDMKESSSVKPAPKPENTKDDNKESETKPIDEKAVPKDLSVSADIKEPQKLVAGVIYDDDDNEENDLKYNAVSNILKSLNEEVETADSDIVGPATALFAYMNQSLPELKINPSDKKNLLKK